jgi:hypothetical protein
MQEAMQDSPEVNLMQPYLIVTPTRFPRVSSVRQTRRVGDRRVGDAWGTDEKYPVN